MSRHEADRDDLLAEAHALVRRIELIDDRGTAIVAGFRAEGSLSIYCGSDVMDQFTATGQLRRAYRDGVLYRTQGTTLAALRRERTETASTLLRTDLTPAQLAAFRQEQCDRLQRFCTDVADGRCWVTRAIPTSDATLLTEILAHLQNVLALESWLAPPIPGKKK